MTDSIISVRKLQRRNLWDSVTLRYVSDQISRINEKLTKMPQKFGHNVLEYTIPVMSPLPPGITKDESIKLVCGKVCYLISKGGFQVSQFTEDNGATHIIIQWDASPNMEEYKKVFGTYNECAISKADFEKIKLNI